MQSGGDLGRIDLTQDSAAQKLAFDTLRSHVGNKPLGVSVAPAQVLRRSVDLPLAARENLHQVLAFEMDRQTPFPAERLYFEYRLAGEDHQKNQISVAFTAVPRQPVDSALAHLRAWEQPPLAVAVADELKGDGGYTNLLPIESRPKPKPWKKLLYAFMALSTLCLIAVLLAVPLWQKREPSSR